MKLSELIAGMEARIAAGDAGVRVRALSYDAEAAGPGSCFFALRGSSRDGHDFAARAAERGAVAVVSERPLPLPQGVVGAVVSDSRRALGIASARFCGDPSEQMALVGVTGTSGKTTTTYLLESIFLAAGRSPGVIGTVEYRFAGETMPAPHTTPQSLDLQMLLRRMRDAGCDCCAMEVSSHALTQERVAGCRFDAAIFTNLTPEHLDYHGDMESYFAAKAILFERALEEGGKPKATAVINADDPYGAQLMRRSSAPVVRFGMERPAEVRGSALSLRDGGGIRMTVETPAGCFKMRSPLCGRFNAQNMLAAAAAAFAMGIGTGAIREGLEALSVVPGRFEAVENGRGVLALVDYAHKPDALEKALDNAREIAKAHGGRLIAVFGCGGDRDRAKRPLMGRTAGEIADVVVVTSDNPRTEDPEAIIGEILPGVRAAKRVIEGEAAVEVIADRERAIARAAEIAREGDVLIVAGKGHEDYQIVGKERRHFDDREVLAKVLGA